MAAVETLVQDTFSLIRPLFCDPLKARERLARAMGEDDSGEGLLRRFGLKLDPASRQRFDVAQAALHDGYHIVYPQQVFGLFNPTRMRETSVWQFDQLDLADVAGRTQRMMQRCAERLAALTRPEQITCCIYPCDPANRMSMVDEYGMTGIACVPGSIQFQLWPSPGNLARLDAVVARLFGLNVRWAHASVDTSFGAAPTLADHLVAQGLASCFAGELAPHATLPAWLVSFRTDEDWEAVLDHVARLQGAPSYNEMKTNTYGLVEKVGPARPSPVAPRDAAELEHGRVTLSVLLDATDPRVIAAALYGDELVSAQGHAPLGVSPYAGLEIAHHFVQAWLAKTKRPFDTAFPLPTSEAIAEAGYFG